MRTEPGRRVQWLQLAVLTLGHGIADIVGGCIPAILPALRERHGLSLAMGVALLTVLNLSCNVLQIPFGRLAGTRTSPAWFCGGLLLTAGVALLAGAPVMAAYLLLAARRPAALGLLVVGGFLAYAAYPLIVTLTRYAATPMRLGSRMGLIVGGVWGTASLTVLALGPLAERFGIEPVLHTVWICYLAAALVAQRALRPATCG